MIDFAKMAHKVTRALVSVSDKAGLTDLCRLLTDTYKARSRSPLTRVLIGSRLKSSPPAAPRRLSAMRVSLVRPPIDGVSGFSVNLPVHHSVCAAVREVSDYTGFPEMLDGRVKTLHPLVHGGASLCRSSHATRCRHI